MIARVRPVLVLSLLAALAACGAPRNIPVDTHSPPAAQGGAYKIGNPYMVDGVWYYPAADPTYDETGIASWYGREFHGQPTANGDTYDMNAMTAAHKTLPMPSRVRVTNLENGRSVVVTINDRGPFVRGRIIDLSRRAAQRLGFANKGTARVRVQAVSGSYLPPVQQAAYEPRAAGEPALDANTHRVVREARHTASMAGLLPPGSGFIAMVGDIALGSARAAPPPSPQPGNEPPAKPVSQPSPGAVTALYVQAGAYSDPNNALSVSVKLAKVGATRITAAVIDGRSLHRVQVGPLANVEAAHELLRRVQSAGHPGARVVAECVSDGTTRWRTVSALATSADDLCM